MPDLAMNVPAWRRATSRWLVILSGFALLLTATAIPQPVAAATDLQQRISATRNGQVAAERNMRQADLDVVQAKARKKASKKAHKKAKHRTKGLFRRQNRMRSIARAAEQAYLDARAARKEAIDEGTDPPFTERKVNKLKDAKGAKNRQYRVLNRKYRLMRYRKGASKRSFALANRRLSSARARRENSEAVLRGTIAYMTQLARERVDSRIDVELTRDGTTFTWPTEGRISGRYGCTNSRFYPRRGSCAHFHDGIDIANVPGTPIRSMAAGVVAFVGWNPSDERGRAFIVVIVHPNGLVSRYGHMLPNRRVAAGQVVRKGEIIARMGSTGFSTGSHLHFELISRGSNIYLPPRGSEPAYTKSASAGKKDRSNKGNKAKKGKKARKRQARAAARAAKARRAQRDAVADSCSTAPPTSTASIGDIVDEPTEYPAANSFLAAVDGAFAADTAVSTEDDDAQCVLDRVAVASQDGGTVDIADDARSEPVAIGPSAPIRSTSPQPQ